MLSAGGIRCPRNLLSRRNFWVSNWHQKTKAAKPHILRELQHRAHVVVGTCLRRILIYCENSGVLSRSTMSNARFAHSYRMLFSPKRRTKPGPNGPAEDLIGAMVEMKKRNSTWG